MGTCIRHSGTHTLRITEALISNHIALNTDTQNREANMTTQQTPSLDITSVASTHNLKQQITLTKFRSCDNMHYFSYKYHFQTSPIN